MYLFLFHLSSTHNWCCGQGAYGVREQYILFIASNLEIDCKMLLPRTRLKVFGGDLDFESYHAQSIRDDNYDAPHCPTMSIVHISSPNNDKAHDLSTPHDAAEQCHKASKPSNNILKYMGGTIKN